MILFDYLVTFYFLIYLQKYRGAATFLEFISKGGNSKCIVLIRVLTMDGVQT